MKRVIMNAAETTAWFVEHVAWEPSYWLGSVPVHVVQPDHWLARHASELPSDVLVHAGPEDDAWKSIDVYDRARGVPPRTLVVIS